MASAWVKSHDCEPGYVYITHPHADHFLGLPEILVAFPEARPVAMAESIPAMEAQISPGYMQVWGGFFHGRLTGKPVLPAPLAGATIPIGGSTATVIPVGTTDTGHSSVVHVSGLSLVVSGLSLVVSGDVVYSDAYVAGGVDTGLPRQLGAGAGCRGSIEGRHSHRRPPRSTGRRRRRRPPDR